MTMSIPETPQDSAPFRIECENATNSRQSQDIATSFPPSPHLQSSERRNELVRSLLRRFVCRRRPLVVQPSGEIGSAECSDCLGR